MEQATLTNLLDQGIIIILKKEEGPKYLEPGLYRAIANRYPWKRHNWEVVASGASVEDAINDLTQIDQDTINKIGTAYFEEDYVPRSLEEAMIYLDIYLSDEAKADVIKRDLENNGFYYGIGGIGMRNAWNLWGTQDDKPKDLHDFFVSLGVGNPGVIGDDASQLIATAYWHHYRNEPFDVKEAAERLRQYYIDRAQDKGY